MATYKNYNDEDVDLDIFLENLTPEKLKLELVRKNITSADQQQSVISALNEIIDGIKNGNVLINSKGRGFIDYSGVLTNRTEGLDTYGHAAAFVGKTLRSLEALKKEEPKKEKEQEVTDNLNTPGNPEGQGNVATGTETGTGTGTGTDTEPTGSISQWAKETYGDIFEDNYKVATFKDMLPLGDWSKQQFRDSLKSKDKEEIGDMIYTILNNTELNKVSFKTKNGNIELNKADAVYQLLQALSDNNKFDSHTISNSIINFIPTSKVYKTKSGKPYYLAYDLSNQTLYQISAYSNPTFVNKLQLEYAKANGLDLLDNILTPKPANS